MKKNVSSILRINKIIQYKNWTPARSNLRGAAQNFAEILVTSLASSQLQANPTPGSAKTMRSEKTRPQMDHSHKYKKKPVGGVDS
jgi:hypothetical protein